MSQRENSEEEIRLEIILHEIETAINDIKMEIEWVREMKEHFDQIAWC